MKQATHSPSSDAFNLVQALKDAGFAGMVTFGLCVPIVAFRAEQDMANKLVLQQRWWMALVITGLVIVSRLLFSLHQHSRRNDHAHQKSEAFAGIMEQIKPSLAPLGFGFITIYPLVMLAMHGPGGSIKWIDNFGIQILIYVMLGWGLNIVVGLAGLLDLGYVAFYAVGAYSYALIATKVIPETFPFLGVWACWICLPISGLLAALWGILLGFPVLRLRGDQLGRFLQRLCRPVLDSASKLLRHSLQCLRYRLCGRVQSGIQPDLSHHIPLLCDPRALADDCICDAKTAAVTCRAGMGSAARG